MTNDKTSIPKIIHYVWLGESKKDKLIQMCINSWKKFCPDYEIIEWNEKRISDIHNQFLTEAIQEKKWAFASDYIRLYALFNFGGLYFDTDLEVKASMDAFLSHDFFCGFENSDGSPQTALLGAKRHDELIKKLLDYYEQKHFIINKTLDQTPNPLIFKEIFSQKKSSFKTADATKRFYLSKTRVVYPIGYFCRPQKFCKNFALHHFYGSWLPAKNAEIRKIFKLGPFEILKTKTPHRAEYPPMLDNEIRELISFEYKYRRRLHLIIRIS